MGAKWVPPIWHPSRKERRAFVAELSARLLERTGPARVHWFRTAHVVSFLLLAEAHGQLEQRFAPFAAVWDDFEVGAAARGHQ